MHSQEKTSPNFENTGAGTDKVTTRRSAIGSVATLGAGALATLVGGMATSESAEAASVYTLSPVDYEMQLKTPGGRVVFEYMTKKPENIGLTSPSVACFHPVNTPSGERITNIAPNDHPNHRGIFFGWHDSAFFEPMVRTNPNPVAPPKTANVRRADFRGWGVYAPRDGPIVQNREIKRVNADANRAELDIHNDLMDR